jgi:hypothetical protein
MLDAWVHRGSPPVARTFEPLLNLSSVRAAGTCAPEAFAEAAGRRAL